MGRRPKPRIWDQIEGRLFAPGQLGQTHLGHFVWAVRFAQSRISDLQPAVQRRVRLQLAAFVRAGAEGGGYLERRRPSAADAAREKTLRKEIMALLRRQQHTEGVKKEIEGKRKELRALVATYPRGVVTPDWPETLLIQNELADRLNRIGTRLEVRYQPRARIVRWAGSLGAVERDGKITPGGRFVILHDDSWSDLAVARFCELAARFGHRVHRCGRGEGTSPQKPCGRYLVRVVKNQVYCSDACRDTERAARQKARRQEQRDRDRTHPRSAS